MNPPVDFYFDFVSPFGYFASLRIEAMAAKHERTVNWHPILIGVTVLKVMGLKPLLDTPLKGPYILREIQRYCRLHGVRLGRSPELPPQSALAASRATAWLLRHRPELAVRFAHLAYAAYWQESRDLNDGDVVRELAQKAGVTGLEPEGDLVQLSGPAAADALRGEMDQALARGVFGSPFVIVDGEPFFGVDKFELIERWLQTRDQDV